MEDVRCPGCDGVIVDVRRSRSGHPTGWMCPHPTNRTATLAYCATCRKVMTIPNLRLAAFRVKKP